MLMIIAQAVLFVLGLMWIREILGRVGSDIEEVKTGDWAGKISTIVIWFWTVGIVYIMFLWIKGLLAPTLKFFQ